MIRSTTTLIKNNLGFCLIWLEEMGTQMVRLQQNCLLDGFRLILSCRAFNLVLYHGIIQKKKYVAFLSVKNNILIFCVIQINISKKFVALHALYAEEIVRAMEKSVSDGHPVNPPVWWVDPTNPAALVQDTGKFICASN